VKFIKLSPITTKGAAIINQHGDIWKLMGQVDKPDTYFFQSRKSQLYIVPSPKPTRNAREEIGDNYTPPNQSASIGARWIQAENDPDFEVTEHAFGRKAA